MNIKDLQKNWNELWQDDPLWSIIARSDKKGKKWEVDEFFETGVREVDVLMRYLKSLGIPLSHGQALDFGCGVGRLTQRLACYFNEVYGVDISRSMIRLAEEYNRKGLKCRYVLNEVDNLQLFADDTFDFIYTNITLQHMKPHYAKKYICEFLRILAPKGLLVFQQPSDLKVKAKGLKQQIEAAAPEILLNLYWKLKLKVLKQPRIEMHGIRREEMVTFLKTQGVKIVDIREDDGAGSDWLSFRYCVTKGARA